jgi:hypothetical protein
MRFRLLAVACLAAALALADTLTVSKVVEFVRSSVKTNLADKDVAAYLAKVKLTDRLDDRVIEQLQSIGIGARTLHALQALRDLSASLPEPSAAMTTAAPVYQQAPPPSAAEQGRLIQEAREYAFNYARSLPDFICTEVVRRSAAPKPRPGTAPDWRDQDTLQIRLSYYQQKEQYKLMLIDNRITNQDYEKVGGAKSFGDFGSLMAGIFDPSSRARFEWARWSYLDRRPVLVFSYFIEQPNSHYEIRSEGTDRTVVPAYSGLVMLDKDTHQVMCVTVKAENLPADFPVKAAETRLYYDYVELSGHTFLLPLKSEITMAGDDYLSRNDEQFRIYRKYSADSEITFGDVDTKAPPPLDDSKTKEGPPVKH